MSKIRRFYKYMMIHDTWFWRGSLHGVLFIAALALVGISLGMPTGFGIWFDIIAITLIGLLIIGMGSFLLSGIIALTRVPLPRFFVGGVICAYAAISRSLSEMNLSYSGAAFITGAIILIGFLLGSSITLYRKKRERRLGYLRTSYMGLSICIFVFCFVWLLSPGREVYSTIQSYDPALIQQEDEFHAKDPSQKGNYAVHAFTYGSGLDIHREEFGKDVDLITESVDASAFLSEWNILRKTFWGFDEHNLPLNGRVWMPEGEGPFPLVLIVHGSHKMEHFSDTGYGYLGELLASRGFITVSVDENFINFSVWSRGIDWDMATRSWVLLQHLMMLEQANESDNTPFYGKIDLENIALIGHSRGGQAASLAAEFDQFYNENTNSELSVDFDLPIKSVIAIAPTDKLIDGKLIRQDNLNYLVLQGSQDSDVNTFYGDRQYARTTFTDEEYRIKTSVYIDGANHGQFNTEWGDEDTTMPTALLLNKKELISGEDQRQIAKTYISAFLEATLHGKEEYIPLFRDYRAAILMKWLPETGYINRFEDSNFIKVSHFEEDQNNETSSISEADWVGENLTEWEEKYVKTRTNNSTRNKAVSLAWDGQSAASYTLELPNDFAEEQDLSQDDMFVFSLADTTPVEDELEQGESEITVEIVTHQGVSVEYPLNEYRIIPPEIHSRFTKNSLFEQWVRDGYLGESTESVLQTFEIPLADGIEQNTKFEPEEIKQVSFIFEKGVSGEVIIDDVGFAKIEE